MRQHPDQTPDPDTVLIFERGQSVRPCRLLDSSDVPGLDLDAYYGSVARRQPVAIPDLAEPEVVRHYTALSRKNFGVDSGPSPLGSCTMKYNPKVHETLASLPGFAGTHPLQGDAASQGNLELMARLEAQLCAICGVDRHRRLEGLVVGVVGDSLTGLPAIGAVACL